MIGYKRSQVFIANVIKCRPPENRDPLPGEIQTCRHWLERQIELIKPKSDRHPGALLHGQVFPRREHQQGARPAKRIGSIIYFAMYHPAAALHQGSLRKVIEADMLKLPAVLAEAGKMEEEKDRPAQLNIF